MSLSRRELLAGATAVGAASLFPRLAEASEPVKPFRFVHMTDFHVQPELHAGEGMTKALQHAMGRKPSFVMLGGDLIMDGFNATEERTKTQWDLFSSILKANSNVPAHYCIGNHDVWGWGQAKSHTSGNEPLWGKKWFLEVAQLDRTYHSFVAGGWKFIVLDTVFKNETGYDGFVDEEQMAWLKSELDATPSKQPVLIVSHIPLFSPSPMVYGFDAKDSTWKVSGSEVTRNFNEVKKLFDTRPNVKLCLSGHIHLVDRYDYNGVSYLCNGAVCGAWWLGKNKDFEPGYVVLDLFPDGTFKHEFVTWGWKPA